MVWFSPSQALFSIFFPCFSHIFNFRISTRNIWRIEAMGHTFRWMHLYFQTFTSSMLRIPVTLARHYFYKLSDLYITHWMWEFLAELCGQWCYFQVHSTVRKRWLDGDTSIRSWMEEVAELAVKGRTAIESRDHLLLAKLMNRNFELRR